MVEVFEWHLGRRPSVVPEEDDDGAPHADTTAPYATRSPPCSPSTSTSPPHALPPIVTDGYRDVWADAPAPASPPPPPLARRASTPSLSARARVFGPERVVLDPRIRAVHRRTVRDLLLTGAVCGTVLTVVVVALPCGR